MKVPDPDVLLSYKKKQNVARVYNLIAGVTVDNTKAPSPSSEPPDSNS